MTDIQFGGVTIPSQQTLSPAGHDDIAFRPACNQLVPVQYGSDISWTLTLSDGTLHHLQQFPPMPELDAFKELDSYGICKLGGEHVPLVYTDQVPQRQVAQFAVSPDTGADVSTAGQPVQAVTPAMPNNSMPLWAIASGGLLLITLAVGFVWLVRREDNRKAQQPKSKQNSNNASALDNLFGGENDA